jgi:hypothetical protein
MRSVVSLEVTRKRYTMWKRDPFNDLYLEASSIDEQTRRVGQWVAGMITPMDGQPRAGYIKVRHREVKLKVALKVRRPEANTPMTGPDTQITHSAAPLTNPILVLIFTPPAVSTDIIKQAEVMLDEPNMVATIVKFMSSAELNAANVPFIASILALVQRVAHDRQLASRVFALPEVVLNIVRQSDSLCTIRECATICRGTAAIVRANQTDILLIKAIQYHARIMRGATTPSEMAFAMTPWMIYRDGRADG